ncbi:FtsW/RodA/SpoVE family cell cycle protein [Streptomyces fractus]|uniref:FtsW/RodA/SpoVE family cell cycle protein n=1 Tax=Streptomyces fractus TaxID=641806 RepID=UPI003CF0D68A
MKKDPVARRASVTEISMLLFAVLIPVYAYIDTGVNMSGSVPVGAAEYGISLVALASTAHLAVRRFVPYADPLMLPLATVLNGMGLVFIWRLDQEPQLAAQGQAAPSQLMFSTLGIGIFLLVIIFLRNHRALAGFTYTALFVALALLISPIFFPSINGAKIWVTIGHFSIQPAEFAKIIICIFFAGYLAQKKDALALTSRRILRIRVPRGRDLGPLFVVWLLSLMIMVMETDLGTALLFFGLFVAMLYGATQRRSWIIFGLVLCVVGLVVAYFFVPHVTSRIDDWLNPFASIDAGQGASQSAQVMFAFGAGGLFGTGLGLGHSYLIGFAAKSDYILGTVGEEIGLIGIAALLIMYLLLAERGFKTSLRARDPFGKLLAFGLSTVFALQVFIVAGGVTGLIPLTGMTMPFLAQGGSSVVTNWALVAILLVISNDARKPAPADAGIDLDVNSLDDLPTQIVRTAPMD